MNTQNLTFHQRTIRQNIRSLFLLASVNEMRSAIPDYRDAFSRECIQEMISKCLEQGVDSFGETY